MPLTFSVVAAKIGAPIAKFLLKRFLGEAGEAASSGLIEIAAKKIESEADQRAAARVFEEISDRIVKRILPLFANADDIASEAVCTDLGATLESV